MADAIVLQIQDHVVATCQQPWYKHRHQEKLTTFAAATTEMIDMSKESNRARDFSILMTSHEVDDRVRQWTLQCEQIREHDHHVPIACIRIARMFAGGTAPRHGRADMAGWGSHMAVPGVMG